VVTHIVLFTKAWTIRKCLLPASNIKLPSSCTKWWLGQPSIILHLARRSIPRTLERWTWSKSTIVLHVSSQLSLLDDYFIIRKYNEFNHCDRSQLVDKPLGQADERSKLLNNNILFKVTWRNYGFSLANWFKQLSTSLPHTRATCWANRLAWPLAQLCILTAHV
jgi:hypothetical protein